MIIIQQVDNTRKALNKMLTRCRNLNPFLKNKEANDELFKSIDKKEDGLKEVYDIGACNANAAVPAMGKGVS